MTLYQLYDGGLIIGTADYMCLDCDTRAPGGGFFLPIMHLHKLVPVQKNVSF